MPPQVAVVNAQTISRQMEWIDMATSELLTVQNISEEVGQAGRQLDLFNRREMQRVLGVDVRRIPGVNALIDQWRDLNVGLIETGLRSPADGIRLRPLLNDVSATVEAAHRQGLRVEVLAHDLRERYGVSDSRAELIARDQVLKLNGNVNRHRQSAAGVREYIWDTSGDERVRETHLALDGSTQSWDSPPEVAPGRFEHPGGDYQCRCIAIPIIPEDGLEE
jgi:SPP1 gp7 family putative phage head morphogenesis protein